MIDRARTSKQSRTSNQNFITLPLIQIFLIIR